jgi:hypothetical protein
MWYKRLDRVFCCWEESELRECKRSRNEGEKWHLLPLSFLSIF